VKDTRFAGTAETMNWSVTCERGWFNRYGTQFTALYVDDLSFSRIDCFCDRRKRDWTLSVVACADIDGLFLPASACKRDGDGMPTE